VPPNSLRKVGVRLCRNPRGHAVCRYQWRPESDTYPASATKGCTGTAVAVSARVIRDTALGPRASDR